MAAFAAKRLVRTRSQLSVFVIHVHFFQFWRKCINLSMQQFLKDYEATPLDKKPILVIGMQVVILYIARIAKAASHKLLGKSSLNVIFVLSCPVLSFPVLANVGIELLWQLKRMYKHMTRLQTLKARATFWHARSRTGLS